MVLVCEWLCVCKIAGCDPFHPCRAVTLFVVSPPPRDVARPTTDSVLGIRRDPQAPVTGDAQQRINACAAWGESMAVVAGAGEERRGPGYDGRGLRGVAAANRRGRMWGDRAHATCS